jgi:hypothetical protein
MLWDASADDLILSGAAGLIVPEGQLTLGSTAITLTAAELNILDGDNTASSVTIVDADRIILNDNGTMKQVAVSALNSYTSSSIAADDIGTGNAAVTITTSSGNITIDAAANDSDVIFKGTDDSSDITMLTLDGSDAGHATFNNAITSGAVITSGAGLVIADAGNIGSASDTDAIAIGSDGDVTLTQDLELQHDGAILSFGAGDDVSLTHTNDVGITLNSTMKLMFNDASQFIQGTSATVLSIGATDEIDLTATAVDLNGTLNVSGVATFQAAPVFPDGSIAVADLDIDGATDIGADIVDADLFIIDDGAGGTNRKTTASRIKTYIGGGTQWQAVKTGNYTAAAGQGVFANTTSSAFTVTLPAGTLGDEVTIVDYAGTFDSNALTVAANGSEKIFGSTDDLTVSTERAAFTLVFTDSTQGWLFKND